MQRKQNTVTRDKHDTELIARGRHDPCVVPRGMPLKKDGSALLYLCLIAFYHHFSKS